MLKCLCVLLFLSIFPTLTIAGDEVVISAQDDPDRVAAVDAARGYLPQFLESYTTYQGDPTDYGVKVAFPVEADDARYEVIWVTYFDQVNDTDFVGRLANAPNFMPGLSLGSDVKFTRDMIEDWYISENGKVYGYFTVRALLPDLTPDQAKSIRSTLQDSPIPAGFQ